MSPAGPARPLGKAAGDNVPILLDTASQMIYYLGRVASVLPQK